MRNILHYGLTYIKSQLGFVSYTNANESNAIDRQ